VRGKELKKVEFGIGRINKKNKNKDDPKTRAA
jgi:hypothetical protein